MTPLFISVLRLVQFTMMSGVLPLFKILLGFLFAVIPHDRCNLLPFMIALEVWLEH